MIDLQTLSLFCGAVMLLLITPGPNMAFVMSHGFTYGWRGGLAVALGISAADAVLTVLTATGVTGLVAAWPPSFDIIRYVGAVYLLWMAWKALQGGKLGESHIDNQVSLRTVFVRAMLNSLLNPKALLFFIVFLPQFVTPSKGMIAEQLILLGLVLTAIAFVFHAALGAFGGTIKRWFAGKKRLGRLQPRLLASVLALMAVRLMVMSRP
ncbi:LysE family translocator [Pseudomonas viridiflava]|uniref:LysE family translocator n=1 Tax=Pseudomonas viridiflava TaxID=33069 RepID=UPI000F05AC7D|nr:LysE family translocator [Pseudomonas viridiflava]